MNGGSGGGQGPGAPENVGLTLGLSETPRTPCSVGQGEAAGEQGHRRRAPLGQGGQGLREEGSVHVTSAIATFSGGLEPALKERRPGTVSDVRVLLPGSEKYLTSNHHIFCIQLHSKC